MQEFLYISEKIRNFALQLGIIPDNAVGYVRLLLPTLKKQANGMRKGRVPQGLHGPCAVRIRR